MKDRNLIFIYGLPRSGTTVLQRLLASSDQVITQDETWLLHRLISTELNPFSSPSNYKTALLASERFEPGLEKHIFQFVCNILIEKTSDSTPVIVEKTPRNYLFVNLCTSHKNVLPIGIVRRPSDIINSYFKEFLFSTFRGYIDYQIDLIYGPSCMVDAKLKKKGSVFKYEELNKDFVSEKLANLTGLDFDYNSLCSLPGLIGDADQSMSLSIRRNKELASIDTIIKKAITKRIIRKYFGEYCKVFDYSINDELDRVDKLSHSSFSIIKNARDIFWLIVYFTQKSLYLLYRKCRRTTNLSKKLTCS